MRVGFESAVNHASRVALQGYEKMTWRLNRRASGASFGASLFVHHFRLVILPYGHCEMERRTLVGVVLSPQPSPVSFNDRAADGEPHAETIVFGRIERLKDFFELIASQPDTTIMHCDDRHVIIAKFCPDRDLALVHRAIFHCLESVQEEIQDDLL